MSVTPMDAAPRASRSLGFMTQSFRAWCPRLGRYVVLRRVILDSTKAITRDAYVLANAFSEERDSTVLRLLDVLPVTDFSDNCKTCFFNILKSIFFYVYRRCLSFSCPFRLRLYSLRSVSSGHFHVRTYKKSG